MDKKNSLFGLRITYNKCPHNLDSNKEHTRVSSQGNSVIEQLYSIWSNLCGHCFGGIWESQVSSQQISKRIRTEFYARMVDCVKREHGNEQDD